MSTPFPLVNPDLTLYYSVSQNAGAIFASLPNGPNIIQDFISPLYTTIPPTPPNLAASVGSICDVSTLFDINNTTRKYDNVVTAVIYLKNGSITISPDILWVKSSSTDNYLLPADSSLLFEINSGTKNYLNKKGFVEIITDVENINRKVNIYFLKTYSATASASASTVDCNGNTITFTETASATSTVSEEDAQQIAETVAQGLVNALLK
jgi:hypothetical protein